MAKTTDPRGASVKNISTTGNTTNLPLGSRTPIVKGVSQSPTSIAARVKARREAARRNIAPPSSSSSSSSSSTGSDRSNGTPTKVSGSDHPDHTDQSTGSLVTADSSSAASEGVSDAITEAKARFQSSEYDGDDESDKQATASADFSGTIIYPYSLPANAETESFDLHRTGAGNYSAAELLANSGVATWRPFTISATPPGSTAVANHWLRWYGQATGEPFRNTGMQVGDVLLNTVHTTVNTDVGFVPFSYDSPTQPRTQAAREDGDYDEPVSPRSKSM